MSELQRLYRRAYSAVMVGAVMDGPHPDGLSQDEALTIAAEFFEAAGSKAQITPEPWPGEF